MHIDTEIEDSKTNHLAPAYAISSIPPLPLPTYCQLLSFD